MDFFINNKFNPTGVLKELEKYGFKEGNYTKVIVTWVWNDDAAKRANGEGIELWDFKEILKGFADPCKESSTYFTDDTLRTPQLISKIGKRLNDSFT